MDCVGIDGWVSVLPAQTVPPAVRLDILGMLGPELNQLRVELPIAHQYVSSRSTAVSPIVPKSMAPGLTMWSPRRNVQLIHHCGENSTTDRSSPARPGCRPVAAHAARSSR